MHIRVVTDLDGAALASNAASTGSVKVVGPIDELLPEVAKSYAFTADLTAGVRVLPLHEEGRLQFVIRNLDGLATIKASFAAQEVTIARLDELAKWWVGQPQHFLEGAQGVQRIEPV